MALRIGLLAFLFGSALAAQQPAQLPAPLKGSNPADRLVLQRVQAEMRRQSWSRINIFTSQSFPLRVEGKPAGFLISGNGFDHGDGDKCFVTLAEPARPVVVLATEASMRPTRDIPACPSVRTLGLLASPNPALIRVGIIYSINQHIIGDFHGAISENSAWILNLDPRTHQLTVDESATDEASKADPQNLPALEQSLR